jgi:hypothetical protein
MHDCRSSARSSELLLPSRGPLYLSMMMNTSNFAPPLTEPRLQGVVLAIRVDIFMKQST